MVLVPAFHFKLCSFCWWERKNIFASKRLVLVPQLYHVYWYLITGTEKIIGV